MNVENITFKVGKHDKKRDGTSRLTYNPEVLSLWYSATVGLTDPTVHVDLSTSWERSE